MSQDPLREEINEHLNTLALRSEVWRAKWIAHEICSRHTDGLADNEHRDFWHHAGYVHTRREVTACINRRAGDRVEMDSEQIILPGYQHLHAYYVVRRDGESIGVPVADMTAEEREAKAVLYRAMGAACYAHADELDKFGRDLRATAA